MKVFLNRQCLLFTVAVILTVHALSAAAVPAKDHKKKLLEKLRNSLNQTEIEEAAAGEIPLETAPVDAAPSETAEANPEAKTVEDETPEKEDKEEKDEEVDSDETPQDDKKSDSADKSEGSNTELATKQEGTSSYLRKNLVKMRTVLKRIFDMFGFRQSKKKEGRQNRMLKEDTYSSNGLEYEYLKEDNIRTTVGAVLGEKECIQKIVCGAGSYLRDVNGKHVILTILENVTPSAWMDTMELLKKSAVTDGDCSFKCLESDQDAADQ